jgi:hypothetical protein
MDSTVERAISVFDETSFTHRAIDGEELRDLILSAVERGESNLRIYTWARTTNRGLRMTSCATIKIGEWPESGGYSVYTEESGQPILREK